MRRTYVACCLTVLALGAGCSGGGATEPAPAPQPASAPLPETSTRIPASIPDAAPRLPTPAPASAPAPPASPIDPEVQEVVYRYIAMFYNDELDALYEKFSPDMKEGMDREKLREFRETIRDRFGAEERVVGEETAQKDIYRAFVRWAHHEKTEDLVEFHWRLRADDSIAGLWLNPAKKKIKIIEN